MKITNTFIQIADDSGATMGVVPPNKGPERSLARLHYDLLIEHPYEFDIDGFNFEVFCLRNKIPFEERQRHYEPFFAKGHPCMRASPLTKIYGFGAHYNSTGKIAIYPVDSKAYGKFLGDSSLKVEMAMRSKRPTVSAKDASANPRLRPNRAHPAA